MERNLVDVAEDREQSGQNPGIQRWMWMSTHIHNFTLEYVARVAGMGGVDERHVAPQKGSKDRHLESAASENAELDRLVRDLLRTVPAPSTPEAENHLPVSFASLAPGRHHSRCGSTPGLQTLCEEIDLEPAISVIAERAQTLTGAGGAAIALRRGDEMVCRARAGRTAPDLGVRLQSDSGISADCVRTGEVMLCHDAEKNPQVDLAACHRLGVRSILAAPLRHFRRTLGVFEVFSAAPYAFAARDVATMQLLSSVMVAAISRLSAQQLSPRHRTA